MRHSPSLLMGLCLVCAGVTVVAAPQSKPDRTVSASRGDVTVPVDVMRAQEFILTAYPELRARSVQISVRADAKTLLTSVVEAVNPLLRKRTERLETLVDAQITFAADGLLQSYVADGAWLNSTQNRQLIDVLREQRLTTDRAAADWLTAVGAVPTRTGAIEKASDLAKPVWSAFLGEGSTASASRFVWRDGVEKNAESARPGHVVEVTSASRAGKPVRFRCEFEPIGGRLVAVTRQ